METITITINERKVLAALYQAVRTLQTEAESQDRVFYRKDWSAELYEHADALDDLLSAIEERRGA